MPYVGVRTAAVVLAAAPDITRFQDADHFVSYAGLNPVTRQSGTSLRGERANRGGHRQLRNALWNSASISLTGHAESKAFYDRKTKIEKKKHGAAVMALARRRARVMFALMRDQVEYQQPPAVA
jgi:transposase